MKGLMITKRTAHIKAEPKTLKRISKVNSSSTTSLAQAMSNIPNIKTFKSPNLIDTLTEASNGIKPAPTTKANKIANNTIQIYFTFLEIPNKY